MAPLAMNLMKPIVSLTFNKNRYRRWAVSRTNETYYIVKIQWLWFELRYESARREADKVVTTETPNEYGFYEGKLRHKKSADY